MSMISAGFFPFPAHRAQSIVLAILGAAVIAAVCAVQPLLALAGVVALVVVLATLRRPVLGLYGLIVFFLIQPSPLYQQYGLLARSYTLSDVLVVLVIIGWFMQVANGTEIVRPNPRLRPALVALVAYFGWQILATAWSPAPTGTLLEFSRSVIEAVVIFALCALLLTDRTATRRAAAVYAAAGLALGVYSIYVFHSLGGFQANESSPFASLAYRAGFEGQALNANQLSVALTLTPPFLLFALEKYSVWIRTAFGLAALGITGLALVILTSRATFLAATCGLIGAVILSRGRGRYGVTIAIAAVVGLFILLSVTGYLPWYFQDRFQQASYDDVGYRLPGWLVGLQLFTHSPIAGLGIGGYETVIPFYFVNFYAGVTATHNQYVFALVNTGIIGFSLLVILLVTIGRTIVRESKRNANALFAFIVLVTSLAAGDYLQAHWIWIAFGILCCWTNSGVPATGVRSADTVADSPVPNPTARLTAPHPVAQVAQQR